MTGSSEVPLESLKEVVDAVGIEPTTSRLRVECSTS